jgi:hypothetical protein
MGFLDYRNLSPIVVDISEQRRYDQLASNERMQAVKLSRDDNGTLPSYAWPGGYPIYYLADDGEAFCPDCANGKNGAECHERNENDGWRIVGQGVHWEGEPLTCVHCGTEIESAYGNPEDDTE